MNEGQLPTASPEQVDGSYVGECRRVAAGRAYRQINVACG